jgi:hypothetical protein
MSWKLLMTMAAEAEAGGRATITHSGRGLSIKFGVSTDRILINAPDDYEGPFAMRKVYERAWYDHPGPHSMWYSTGRKDQQPTRFTSKKNVLKRARNYCKGTWRPGGDLYIEILPWRADGDYPTPALPSTKPWVPQKSAATNQESA